VKKVGFKVGDIQIECPLVLAPMEDVSNIAMRRIAKEIGNPGLMFTEFVSAMAIHYGAKKTYKKLRIHPLERPLGIQIFGGDVDTMAETARIVEEAGADILDINMGCWVPKVCKTGAGAALLKDPDLAERIVDAVVKAVKIPVTVKVRAGWDYSLFAAPDLVQRFQDRGAKMITLHARFAKQGFEGEADWALIESLRSKVHVPLIGNGDVKTGSDALAMMDRTGCDGVMVGRAAISNPWSLQGVRAALMGEPAPAPPTLDDRIECALRHARLMVAYECGVFDYEEVPSLDAPDARDAEVRAIRALRGQLPMYIKGAPGASQVRAKITQCNAVCELEEIFERYRSEVDDWNSASETVA
jgi:tRNA-dihydrouridine synthase B